ncbi:MAG: endonuclease V [Flavobacteriales bacterium]|nr:endonuclease V [Flavobacteriales bacterium]
MILAFDTYYHDNKAKTVCLAFEHWEDSIPFALHEITQEGIAEYIPGEFYKRELPGIIDLLSTLSYDFIEAIIIDGFVFLDDEMKPGLGARLYHALEGKIPVIGVAKTNFAAIHFNKRVLYRGESQRPLYITSAGLDLDDAFGCVKKMNGTHRIPTLLKVLDQKTKELNSNSF